jgi:hypothetical protein
MRRPSAARKALGLSPLVQAGWANTSRVERVPFESAGAELLVFFAGRPAAERAADARAGGVVALVKSRFAVEHVAVRHPPYIMEHVSVRIEPMIPADWEQVCAIYEEGIATGLGTF